MPQGFIQLKREQDMKVTVFIVALHRRVNSYDFFDSAERCQENS